MAGLRGERNLQRLLGRAGRQTKRKRNAQGGAASAAAQPGTNDVRHILHFAGVRCLHSLPHGSGSEGLLVIDPACLSLCDSFATHPESSRQYTMGHVFILAQVRRFRLKPALNNMPMAGADSVGAEDSSGSEYRGGSDAIDDDEDDDFKPVQKSAKPARTGQKKATQSGISKPPAASARPSQQHQQHLKREPGAGAQQQLWTTPVQRLVPQPTSAEPLLAEVVGRKQEPPAQSAEVEGRQQPPLRQLGPEQPVPAQTALPRSAQASASGPRAECPVCGRNLPLAAVNAHLDACLAAGGRAPASGARVAEAKGKGTSEVKPPDAKALRSERPEKGPTGQQRTLREAGCVPLPAGAAAPQLPELRSPGQGARTLPAGRLSSGRGSLPLGLLEPPTRSVWAALVPPVTASLEPLSWALVAPGGQAADELRAVGPGTAGGASSRKAAPGLGGGAAEGKTRPPPPQQQQQQQQQQHSAASATTEELPGSAGNGGAAKSSPPPAEAGDEVTGGRGEPGQSQRQAAAGAAGGRNCPLQRSRTAPAEGHGLVQGQCRPAEAEEEARSPAGEGGAAEGSGNHRRPLDSHSHENEEGCTLSPARAAAAAAAAEEAAAAAAEAPARLRAMGAGSQGTPERVRGTLGGLQGPPCEERSRQGVRAELFAGALSGRAGGGAEVEGAREDAGAADVCGGDGGGGSGGFADPSGRGDAAAGGSERGLAAGEILAPPLATAIVGRRFHRSAGALSQAAPCICRPLRPQPHASAVNFARSPAHLLPRAPAVKHPPPPVAPGARGGRISGALRTQHQALARSTSFLHRHA